MNKEGIYMKIAITANGNTLKSLVTEEFEKSEYLLILETDDNSYEYYDNSGHLGDDGTSMATKILKTNCEGLITGSIGEKAFEEIAAAQVTRYLGSNYSVEEALLLMKSRKLDLIRDYRGAENMPDRHHHGSCECGEDHE